MPQWAKYSVLWAVVAAWLAFVAVSLVEHTDIPLAVWSVPGATFALLSDKRKKNKED